MAYQTDGYTILMALKWPVP